MNVEVWKAKKLGKLVEMTSWGLLIKFQEIRILFFMQGGDIKYI